VEGELGHGGMGRVRLARQPELDRRVVLKSLRRDLADDPELVRRFEREARAAAELHHQNVVALYDAFVWRGERYLVQEHVDGEDLGALLKRAGRVEPRVAAAVALEVARGLEAIHARGVVHRDLKPPNVLVGRRGEVKVADFGVALPPRAETLTRASQAVGTLGYMAPEQLAGERVDPRADLFALGVLLYEMCAGRHPFEGGEAEATPALLRRIEGGRYPPLRRAAPRTPRALARLVQRCLRPRPRRRPPDAAAVRRALERQLGMPSSPECQEAVAAWLRARSLLKPARSRATRRVPPPPSDAGGASERPLIPRRRALVAGLAVAVLGTAVALGLALEAPSLERLPLADWLRLALRP